MCHSLCSQILVQNDCKRWPPIYIIHHVPKCVEMCLIDLNFQPQKCIFSGEWMSENSTCISAAEAYNLPVEYHPSFKTTSKTPV